MKELVYPSVARRFLVAFFVTLSPCHLVTLSPSHAQEDTSLPGDEALLQSAGLSDEGPALLAFFHARAQTDIDHTHLHGLLRQFVNGSSEQRAATLTELLGLGPLALPVLRQTANDLDQPHAAERAQRVLPWLEGKSSNNLLAAAARMLAKRKPQGAAAALLAYLPYAVDHEVISAVHAALHAVAAPQGKPDPALLSGLTDPMGVRRAAAGVALASAVPPDQVPDVRQLLKDPSPAVRLRAAKALAEANDAEAIPVLIDLLADLPAAQRKPIEEFLGRLAGEWTPVAQLGSEDRIARKIRRDAWRAWWQNTDGDALLAVVREHTLTPQMRLKIQGLIKKLGNEEFPTREAANKELLELGRITLPQLREAAKEHDLEVVRRARQLIEGIEQEPTRNLPCAAIRLLAIRKPAAATEALLAYLPLADEENLTEDVKKALSTLALRNGKLDSALERALGDDLPPIRAAAAESLLQGGGTDGLSAVRKLLKDDAPLVRERVALAMVQKGHREAVPVLIDLLAELSGDQIGQVEDTLHELAGDNAPDTPLPTDNAEKKKCRDAWAAWWKANAERVDLKHLSDRPWYGYTVLCDSSNHRVYEIDRDGKERWAIAGVPFPVDAWVVGNHHVLIAEYNGQRVSERDFKGKVLWSKEGLANRPVNVQRMPNGNTFIATLSQLLEVDRAGKEVYTINNVAGGITAAYRARNGNIICLASNGQCIIMDTSGKHLKTFASNRNAGWTSGLDLLSNGHVLITQPNRNKVAEYDLEGKLVVEVDAPQATTATGLRNGHFLIASNNNQRAFEVDRTGKIVWEHKGNGSIFRARRR
jgi:HEAT repeat protein